MKKRIEKLLMVTSTKLKIPYGTRLSVTREHKSKNHWITTEAENNKPFSIDKNDVREV